MICPYFITQSVDDAKYYDIIMLSQKGVVA